MWIAFEIWELDNKAPTRGMINTSTIEYIELRPFELRIYGGTTRSCFRFTEHDHSTVLYQGLRRILLDDDCSYWSKDGIGFIRALKRESKSNNSQAQKNNSVDYSHHITSGYNWDNA